MLASSADVLTGGLVGVVVCAGGGVVLTGAGAGVLALAAVVVGPSEPPPHAASKPATAKSTRFLDIVVPFMRWETHARRKERRKG
jgi:hypothetical protein